MFREKENNWSWAYIDLLINWEEFWVTMHDTTSTIEARHQLPDRGLKMKDM